MSWRNDEVFGAAVNTLGMTFYSLIFNREQTWEV